MTTLAMISTVARVVAFEGVATVANGLDLGKRQAYIRGMTATIKSKMTKLESFVWNNPHVTFVSLATQTNRPVSAIERAYDRAKRKADLASQANIVKPFDYTLTAKA